MYRDDLTALQAALDAAKQQLAEQTTLRQQAEEAAHQAELTASYITGQSGQRRLRLLLYLLGAAALGGLLLAGLLVFRLGQSQRELQGLIQTVDGLRQERTSRKASLINCQAALGAAHIPRQLELRCDDDEWAERLYPLLASFYDCMGRSWDMEATKPIHVVVTFSPEGEKNQVLLKNAHFEPGQQLCLLHTAEALRLPAGYLGVTTLAFSLYPHPL